MENKYDAISGTIQAKKDLENFKSKISKNVSTIKSVMNTTDDIDMILEKYTLEEVNNMSYSKMKEVFVDQNEHFLFDEKEFPKDMIIDFIRYLKLSQYTFEKLDDEFADIDKTMKEFEEEMKSISSNIESLNKTLLGTINKALEDPEVSDVIKANAENMKQGLKDAYTLEPILELYDKIDPKNTLREFRDIDRQNNMLKSYVKRCKEYNIKPLLLKLGGIEKHLDLPEETEQNLILYVIAKYIRCLDTKLKKHRERTFVIQLTNYMMSIILGEESESYKADKEEIEELKKNLALLASKFYN